MSSDDVGHLSDDVGTGKQPNEFPLDSLRQKLLPGQLTKVKIFWAGSELLLERDIDDWVDKTQNIIVIPGPPQQFKERVGLAVTYIPAYKKGS